jgi:hypothetical protein
VPATPISAASIAAGCYKTGERYCLETWPSWSVLRVRCELSAVPAAARGGGGECCVAQDTPVSATRAQLAPAVELCSVATCGRMLTHTCSSSSSSVHASCMGVHAMRAAHMPALAVASHRRHTPARPPASPPARPPSTTRARRRSTRCLRRPAWSATAAPPRSCSRGACWRGTRPAGRWAC